MKLAKMVLKSENILKAAGYLPGSASRRRTSVRGVAAVTRAGRLLLPGRAQGGQRRAHVALVLLADRPRRWYARVRRIAATHWSQKFEFVNFKFKCREREKFGIVAGKRGISDKFKSCRNNNG